MSINSWRSFDQVIRNDKWKTKNNDFLRIGDMDSTHLLRAYKKTRDERLFKEMVVRLFEKGIK